MSAKPSTGLGIGLDGVILLIFSDVCIGKIKANVRIIRVEQCDLFIHRQGLEPAAVLLMMLGKRRVMGAGLGERSLPFVELGEFSRNFNRVRLNARNFVIDGDRFLRESLRVVMLRDL